MKNMTVEEKVGSPQAKRPGWSRALDILLRTGHIGVIGVLLGGATFQAPLPAVHCYAWLVVITGLGLVGTELHHSLRWPHEGRGLMAFSHMLPIVLLHLWPAFCVELLWIALVVGAIGSHMPRSLRHWSLVYGKVPKKQ
ncbi:hypothetical protein [Syntrophotalea acetylenivorans]|nr:hypothetical protein [Syntrophotalea acetylenivorans]